MPLHPAIPIVVVGTLLGWWATRRRLGPAVLVAGAVATAFLAPALMVPTGIPSPAATLSEVPPWQRVGDPAEGNSLLGDVTFQIQPWLLHLRRELRAGRLPFWNPYQFSGAPFWGNGQSAPLFPLHLLFVALPLELGFVLLPWARLVLAGVGTWLLAERLGLQRPGVLLAAVAYPLSGMMASFLLFPMANALALVPWVLWATEGLAAGAAGWVPLGLLAGLQLLGGHPETAIHTAMVAALYLAVRGGSLAAWRRFVIGWVVGGAVAAVQLLPLLLNLVASSKWLDQELGGSAPLSLLLQQPLRLALPELFGHPARGTWWGPFNHNATAVFVGAAALPLAVASWPRLRRDRRLLALGVVVAFSFLAAYHVPGVRHVLQALPILERVAHSRLMLAIELGLALLAGAGLDRVLRHGERRWLLLGVGLAAGLLAIAWWLFADDWRSQHQVPRQLAWTAWGLLWPLALAALPTLRPSRRRLLAAPIAAVVVVELLAAHIALNPPLPLERLYPVTPAVAFLGARPGRVAGVGWSLNPNGAMVYRLYDVRGNDPVKLARYERVYEQMAAPDPVYFRPISDWEDPWLDRLGVAWVLTGPEHRGPPVPSWEVAYRGGDGVIFRRPGAEPVVRWLDDAGAIEVGERQPGLWRLRWRAAEGGRLVVAENWDPGWKARCDGTPCTAAAHDQVLIAVDLPPGGGDLELRYRPPGIGIGAAGSAAGLLLLATGSAWGALGGAGRRRRDGREGPAGPYEPKGDRDGV
ncbi:MAG TPA: hypothetical protein VMT16_08910 [Thermoanaerobaculia bacterium]|nr:hypothetical protein [Thermoanaerobaculia bacterium]